MIRFSEDIVMSIPVLRAVPEYARDRPLPTLFVLHPLGVSRELVSYSDLIGARLGSRVLHPAPFSTTRE